MSPLRLLRLVLALAAVLAAGAGCATAERAAPPAPLLLISLDGFRWDYCDLYPEAAPHLRRLRAEGVSARSLIPPFPSNTFPGHYTIVTGLRPVHHGMINNTMYDPEAGRFFRYHQPASNQDARWWGGEPIWNTAARQGRAAATSFWPGSEAAVGGRRPAFWKPYNYSIPFEERLDELAGWLALPAEQRPAVVTFYLEETNSAGHEFGPDSPELAAAVKLIDARVGAIRERLEREGRACNLVIVSDHGMTPVSLERVIVLDDYLDLSTVQVDFEGSVAGLRPLAGSAAELVAAFAKLPPEQARAYAAADLPAHFHLGGGSPRIPPVWIVPAEGWQVLRRAVLAQAPSRRPVRADHGYDPAFPSMHGILVAHGPAFRTGGTAVEPVESIHIYNLLCAALGLEPAPNDGDDRLVRQMLAR